MAKVEMSLSEYNAMKEELDFLHRVVREITTPKVDDWSLDYIRSNHASSSGYADLSQEVKDYLTEQIKSRTPESYQNGNYTSEVKLGSISIIEVSYSEPTEEVANEQEDTE